MPRQVTIYGMPNCKWCKMAVELCRENDIAYTYEEALDKEKAGLVLDVLGFEGDDRTMPKVYEDGETMLYIGGYAELKEWISK